MLSTWRSYAWIAVTSAVGLGMSCSASNPHADDHVSSSGTGSVASTGGAGGGDSTGGQGGGIDLCSCPAPLADCNADPSDGCEVDTSRDVMACGSCSPCEEVDNRITGHGSVECIEGQCKLACEDDLARGVGCWDVTS